MRSNTDGDELLRKRYSPHNTTGFGWFLAIVLLSVVAIGYAFDGCTTPAHAKDAPTWSKTITWRDSTVLLISSCGPISEDGVRTELEDGRARAVRDLGASVKLPPLGTPRSPYIVMLTPNLGKLGVPGLPPCRNAALDVKNAMACTRDAPAFAKTNRRWSMMVGQCNALAALDHEGPGGHSGCLLYRPLVEPPRTLADVVRNREACLMADHQRKGGRFDVAGRPR